MHSSRGCKDKFLSQVSQLTIYWCPCIENLVPKFELVDVLKIEINLHKPYNFDVLVNNILLFHVSEYVHARELTKDFFE